MPHWPFGWYVFINFFSIKEGCAKLKNITSESESPVLMLSKSACSYTKSEAQEEPSFVETKSRKSEYIKAILEGEKPPSQQLYAFVSVTTELNAFRKANNQPLVDFLLVIEDFGEYPYEVYRITQKGMDLGFTFIGRVFDDKEYKQMFQID